MSAAAVGALWGVRRGYTKVPHAYFDNLFGYLTQVELGVLGLLLSKTVGERGEPHYTDIQQSSMARLLDVSVSAIETAVRVISGLGLVAKARRGKRNQYKPTVEAWAKPVDAKLAKKLRNAREEETEAEPETEAESEAEVAPATAQVMVILPGQKKPIPLSEACPNAATCALLDQHENCAGNKKETTSENKVVNIKIPTVSNGYHGGEPQPIPSPSANDELRLALNEVLEGKLGPVTDHILAKIDGEMSDILSIGDLTARIRVRRAMFDNPSRSWTGVLLLATELAEAKRKAVACAKAAKGANVSRAAKEPDDPERVNQARLRFADPYLDPESREWLKEEFPQLADWKPSADQIRAAVAARVRQARETIRDFKSEETPSLRLEEENRKACELLTRIRAEYPEAVALAKTAGGGG